MFEAYATLSTRPFTRLSVVKRDDKAESSKVNCDLERKSLTSQESLLLDDLLYVLMGIEGDYITISNNTNSISSDSSKSDDQSISFTIDPAFDSSLRTLVYRILPICVDFNCISKFCDKFCEYKNGTVIQAFTFAVRTVLEEYFTLIGQFETQHSAKMLSVQKLWFYVQPVQRTMQVLATICDEIAKISAHGGAVLSLLHRKSCELAGDTVAVDLCRFLLSTSSKPYLSMLERWLYAGEIYDPCFEFMIRENVENGHKQLSGALFDEIDDWACRYFIKTELCPDYLTPIAKKILNCGKYLNILFSCGFKQDEDQVHSFKKPLRECRDDHEFSIAIENMHNFASRALVRLLAERYSLLNCFTSLKHYFLIDQGDWLLYFLELANDELNLCLDDVRPHRLESFLDLAVKTSSLAYDFMRDDIKIYMKSSSLTSFLLQVLRIDGDLMNSIHKLPTEPADQVKAIEAVTIKYDAQWPLSIIFNRKCMLQYEIIFRRLLLCKFIERQLSCCWISKRRGEAPESLLLHEMLTFLKNYLYFITAEVIEPNWHKFYTTLNESLDSITIDDTLKEHNTFLDHCTKDCLLTDADLVESVDQILSVCSEFASSLVPETDKLKERFDSAQLLLLERMQHLSVVSQERIWTDIAYRLDLNCSS